MNNFSFFCKAPLSKTSGIDRAFFLIPMLFVILYPAYASKKSDSLRLLIINQAGKTQALSVLYAEFSRELFATQPDSAMILAKNGLQMAEKTGYSKGIIMNCIQIGRNSIRVDDFKMARSAFERASALISDDTDPNDQMRIFNGLGLIFDLQSDFSNALERYIQGLTVAEKFDNTKWKSFFYNNIAVIYNRTGNYRKGLDYYQRALPLFTLLNDSNSYANALINLGLVYKGLKMPDSARYFFDKSLPIQMRLKNYYGLVNLFNNLGGLKL